MQGARFHAMQVSPDTIRQMLELAVQAPSGDNAQPWRFFLHDHVLSLYNLPDRDASLYNFQQRGSFIAHGAVVENIAVAAPAFGYQAEAALFPKGARSSCTAAVSLTPIPAREDPLYPYIRLRATNRKPYTSISLEAGHRAELQSAAAGVPGVALRLVDVPERVRSLARVISVNDRLILENRTIHDGIFGSIRWTKDEERTKPGLLIDTLELAPPQRAMFRLFRHWGVVNALNRIGLGRFLAAQTAKLYAASSAFGILVIDAETDERFFQTGRALQRIWLTATKLGVRFQPITAIAYLAQRVFSGDREALPPQHVQWIENAYREICHIADIRRGTIAMIFRVGYGDPPSAQSLKRSPDMTVEH